MSNKKKKRKNRVNGSPSWMVAGCIGKADKQDFQDWRDRGFFTANTNSEVRRIDPITGKSQALESIADDILKANRNVAGKSSRKAKKRRFAEKRHVPSVDQKDTFYKSWEWRRLRMQAIKLYGRVCACCGSSPSDMTVSGEKVKIVVDHIKPLSKFWHMRLELSNLQILCDECNQGKGNWDETDFRPPAVPDEWVISEDDDVALDVLASMEPANGRPA